MRSEPTVFVVDDDNAVRKAISRLLKSVNIKSELYSSAQDFLENYDPGFPGCLVLDVRMPGMSGLDLQETLATNRIPIPIIIITGYADVPMAIQSLKMGATDFIEKPFNDQVLLDSISQALDKDAKIRKVRSQHDEIAKRVAQLSSREREVMDMVVAGQTNKVIAYDLKLSQKTVEFHRANVMKKMNAETLVELIHFVNIYKEII